MFLATDELAARDDDANLLGETAERIEEPRHPRELRRVAAPAPLEPIDLDPPTPLLPYVTS